MNRLLTKTKTSFKQLLLLLFLMGIPLAGYSCMYQFPDFLWGIELYPEENYQQRKVIPNYDFVFSDADISNVEQLYSSVVLWYNNLPPTMNNRRNTLYLDILVGEDKSEVYYNNIEKLGELIEQKLDRRILIVTQAIQFYKPMSVPMNKIIFAGLESYHDLSSGRILTVSLEEALTFWEKHPIPKQFKDAYPRGDSYYYYSNWLHGYGMNTINKQQPELSYKTNSKRKRMPPIAPHTEIRSLFLYEIEDDKEKDKNKKIG